ncbi:MAG: hypothetical protein IJJ63_00855 [Bacilli bacterium]|nr:hypothetical protein [Bacilli bacterium]MBQ6404576.1 hypothetical protein [Bacilli bacterium]
MGKYNLGKSNASVNIHITKDNLFIDEKRCNELINNIDNNLELIEKTMLNIERILNRSVSLKAVTSTRVKVFKSWARKCKSQATSVERLREKLATGYDEDVRYYPIKVLDDRIKELEEKIALLEKSEKR